MPKLTADNMLPLVEFYNKLLEEVYHEHDTDITKTVIDNVLPIYVKNHMSGMPLDSKILDLGCGSGYALEKFRELGYTNLQGLTFNKEDQAALDSKGFPYISVDFNFSGIEEEFDVIWMRQVLEHSPFPFYTLTQLNKMLKPGGKMYIETPAPNNPLVLEHWPNHYSVMGKKMFVSLMLRSGFDVIDTELTGKANTVDGNERLIHVHIYYLTKIGEPAIHIDKISK